MRPLRAGWIRVAALAALTSAARAQPLPEPAETGVAPPSPIRLAPVYEGGVLKNRGINIPLNTGLAPERRLSFGYTASNSYLNPGQLCRFADSVCEVDYETDHTGNLWFVDLRQPLFGSWDLGVAVGTYALDEIPIWALTHRLAGDSALRIFHEDILGEDSLPELSGAPDDREVFTLEDPAGRELRLAPGHRYALPLRVDLVRYLELRRNEHVQMGVNVGMHLSYPLEGDLDAAAGQTAFARGLDFGIALNFVRSGRTTANLTSTFHIQIARFRGDVSVLHPGSPVNGDDRQRSQYALTYGLGFANTFGGRAPCAFSIGQVTNSAHYDKDTYWAWDSLVPEGGNNLRGALAGANDYGVLTFGCERRAQLFQIAVVEDIAGFSQLVSDDGSGTSYDPDFVVSVSASWRLGAGRASPAE